MKGRWLPVRALLCPEDNKSAADFISLLEQAPVEVLMEDYGGFEKVGSLPVSLIQRDGAITTCPGM